MLAHNHDLTSIFWDPLRKGYAATVSFYITGPTWSGTRRVTKDSIRHDLLQWTEPWFVLTPDDKLDEGETQFLRDGHASIAECGLRHRCAGPRKRRTPNEGLWRKARSLVFQRFMARPGFLCIHC